MGRRRSFSFYGENQHHQVHGQCDVISDESASETTSTSDASEAAPPSEGNAKKPTALDIPAGSDEDSEPEEIQSQPDPGRTTPKPIRRQPTQAYKGGRPSLSVHEKVKILLNGHRNQICTDGSLPATSNMEAERPPVGAKDEAQESQGVGTTIEADLGCNQPLDLEVQRFIDILRTYNYTEGPHEAIELLANDCEWGTLSYIAARIYRFFRRQEDNGKSLSNSEFQLKALVDDFLVRVFDRDERTM